jgi:hypothetical protein
MKLATLIALALLAGCVSMPTPQETGSANYGPYPSGYQQIVHQYFDATLKDPGSAQYAAMTKPKQYWVHRGLNTTVYGYLVCTAINAKNSFGGYVGFRNAGFLIRDGRVIEYLQDGYWGSNNACAGTSSLTG